MNKNNNNERDNNISDMIQSSVSENAYSRRIINTDKGKGKYKNRKGRRRNNNDRSYNVKGNLVKIDSSFPVQRSRESNDVLPSTPFSIIKLIFRLSKNAAFRNRYISNYFYEYVQRWLGERGYSPDDIDDIVESIHTIFETSFEMLGIVLTSWRKQSCRRLQDSSGSRIIGDIFSGDFYEKNRNLPHLLYFKDASFVAMIQERGISTAVWKSEFIAPLNQAMLTPTAISYCRDLFENYIELSETKGATKYLDCIVEDTFYGYRDLLKKHSNTIAQKYHDHPYLRGILIDLGFQNVKEFADTLVRDISGTSLHIKKDDGTFSNSLYNIPSEWLTGFDDNFDYNIFYNKSSDEVIKYPFDPSEIISDYKNTPDFNLFSNETNDGDTYNVIPQYKWTDNEILLRLGDFENRFATFGELIRKINKEISKIDKSIDKLSQHDEMIYEDFIDYNDRLRAYLADSFNVWLMDKDQKHVDYTARPTELRDVLRVHGAQYEAFKETLEKHKDKLEIHHLVTDDEIDEIVKKYPNLAFNENININPAVMNQDDQSTSEHKGKMLDWRVPIGSAFGQPIVITPRQLFKTIIAAGRAKAAFDNWWKERKPLLKGTVKDKTSPSYYSTTRIGEVKSQTTIYSPVSSSSIYSFKFLKPTTYHPLDTIKIFGDTVKFSEFANADRFRLLRPYASVIVAPVRDLNGTRFTIFQNIIPGVVSTESNLDVITKDELTDIQRIFFDSNNYSFPSLFSGNYFPISKQGSDRDSTALSCFIPSRSNSIFPIEDGNSVVIKNYNFMRNLCVAEIYYHDHVKLLAPSTNFKPKQSSGLFPHQ